MTIYDEMGNPGPHFGRWCVVDEDTNHVYCSFSDATHAQTAAREMNTLVRRDQPGPGRGPVRSRVKVVHYGYQDVEM